MAKKNKETPPEEVKAKKKKPRGVRTGQVAPPAPGHPGDHQTIDGLSPMKSLFVRHYLITMNAREAARLAGYKNKMSANNLMNEPKVAAAIKRFIDERKEKLDISAEKVLQEVAAIAFANLTDVVDFNKHGINMKDSRELKEYVKSAIAEVSETVTGKSTTVKVKMHDKVAALEKLMKHLGLYPTGKESEKDNGANPLTLLLEAVRFSQQKQLLEAQSKSTDSSKEEK